MGFRVLDEFEMSFWISSNKVKALEMSKIPMLKTSCSASRSEFCLILTEPSIGTKIAKLSYYKIKIAKIEANQSENCSNKPKCNVA